jgi:glycosyltransferase involved in cell wall biosynthesis
MKLSLNNGDSKVHTGFGHATLKLMSNIPKTGHSLLLNRSAPIEVTFSHPEYYHFINPNAYKVGYTAWESTELKRSWIQHLDKINELWVPNKFCEDVFQRFVDIPIRVFPHGIDGVFERKQREYNGVVKFLHVGHPAYRKNLHDTINAFLELYKGRMDVTLTIKAYDRSGVIGLDEPNIHVIEDTVSYAEMVKILHDHHILFYPSWGEGFGLIPLQALATGMPVVVVDGWCDYDYFVPDLIIKSDLKYNPWQMIHPGKMFQPDYDDIKQKMLYCEENIEMLLNRHYLASEEVHRDWAWEKVVADHFKEFETRDFLS